MPTSTPTASSWLPTLTSTPGPSWNQGPTATATPRPTVNPTPIPLGSVNPTDLYWSIAAPVAEDLAEKIGVPTVIRAGGRFIGTFPFPVTMLIGYGASVGPNVVGNVRSGNGLTSPDLYADLAVDSAGYVVSIGGGWTGAVFGTAIGGPGPGTGVGDFVGSVGTSVSWDVWIAPSVRSWIMSNVFGE